MAIFGSGVQAASQLEAVCVVRDIKTATVFDLDRDRSSAFAEHLSDRLKIAVVPAATPTTALADADIVCTATTSPIPVFRDEDVAPGTHINAIGVYKPNEREIPAKTVGRAMLVVDEIEAAWEEAGDLIMAFEEGVVEKNHIHAELGDIVAGNKQGRDSNDQITMFKSVGVANQDLSAAHAVLARGSKLELGSVVSL